MIAVFIQKETAMKKATKKTRETEARSGTLMLSLAEVIGRDLREFVATAGTVALGKLLEQERTELCGERYRHDAGRGAYRAGHAMGALVLGGRRISMPRPRARTVSGEELELPSWARFSCEDPLSERAVEQMLLGVSTRRYEPSLETLPESLGSRGTSKSAVSRRFVAATEAQLHDWLGRRLEDIDLIALLIDGLYVDNHVLLVALGIDTKGVKHVLGVRIGATENSAATTALLVDLRERGMRTDQKILAVLDGSKALRKSVVEVLGDNAVIQRCQVHKVRNVIEQLPEAMRASVRASMRQAYTTGDAARAKKLLENLARTLRQDHPDAAGSLLEGLDETLTVMRFGLPPRLERLLSTTNAIENLIGSARERTRRVKRWKDGSMVLRWIVAAMHDASRRFRRVWAHDHIGKLVAALRPSANRVAVTKKAA
jgi:transposase-like protein